jgi:hypothetical protein
MENKTIDKLKEIKFIINNNFKDEIFSYAQINQLLIRNNVEQMNFYYFIYSGCLKVVHKGEYQVTPFFYKLTIEEVYKYAQEELRQKRKIRLMKIKQGEIIVNKDKPTEKNISEKNAIILLKKLGYKIMKPIQQFEEI